MLSSTYILVKSVEINIFHVNNRRGALCLSQGSRMGYPACRPVDQWQRSQSVRRSLMWCLLCYLGDCLSPGGGCELASITRWRVAWGKFIELLSVITFHSFPITSREIVYNSCVRSAMLHASETWAPTLCDLHRLQRNDQAMICCYCYHRHRHWIPFTE